MQKAVAADYSLTACLCSIAVAFCILPSPLLAQTNSKDICARWATTKPMRLIVACSEVIRGDPNAAWAYLNRGMAHGAGGDSGREIADYDKAIELDPKLGNAYRNRGVVFFDKGDFPAATADLAQAVKLNGDAYAVLYLHLAKAHGGDAATTELETNAAKLNAAANWPQPIVELYLGKRTPAAALAAATTREQRCEAQFYIGEQHAVGSNKTDAARALRLALAACAKDTVEFGSAIAELKRLGAWPPKPARPKPAPAAGAPSARSATPR